jgi:hypothetical protein
MLGMVVGTGMGMGLRRKGGASGHVEISYLVIEYCIDSE